MNNEIDGIKAAAGEYYKWALLARKRYYLLLQQSDLTIAKIYASSVRRILKEYRRGRNKNLLYLLQAIGDDVAEIDASLGREVRAMIGKGVDAGVYFSRAVTLEVFRQAEIDTDPLVKMFDFQRKRAVEMSFARAYKDGLKLSDRIWNVTDHTQKVMADIVRAGVGEDAVVVAKALESYVRVGRQDLAANYPNMLKRMGGRVPLNIDYNALRLARTELTAAYGEGTIAAAKSSPAIGNVRWVLSASHPRPDICDAHASGGNGRGVYPADDCPPYPAHPHCLCTLQPEPEDTQALVRRLKAWRSDALSQPAIESWYQQNCRLFS